MCVHVCMCSRFICTRLYLVGWEGKWEEDQMMTLGDWRNLPECDPLTLLRSIDVGFSLLHSTSVPWSNMKDGREPVTQRCSGRLLRQREHLLRCPGA